MSLLASREKSAERGQEFEAIVFDAYGTLFDVSSVTEECDRIYPGRGIALSNAWRRKQLEYTWLRALARRYKDFESITRDALKANLIELGLNCPQEIVEKLLAEYRKLRPFPDVKDAIKKLSSSARLGILSNGTSKMLHEIIGHANLSSMFEAVISAEKVHTYKPDPSVYGLAITSMDISERNRLLFVSANGWDVAGAKSFGLRAAWVARGEAQFSDWPEYLPDYQVQSMSELAALVERG